MPGQVTLSQDEQHQRKRPENQRVFRKAVEQDRGNQNAHAAQPSAQRDRQIKNGQLAGRRSESVCSHARHGEDKQPQRMNCKYPERTARGKIKEQTPSTAAAGQRACRTLAESIDAR